MTQPVKPIRAWADYDEWWVLLDSTGYDTTPGNFEPWEMPKGRTGGPWNEGEYTGIVVAIEDMNHGPLRSFRVLFDNGYELRLRHGSREHGETFWFYWNLSPPLPAEGVYAPVGPVAQGSINEDKDHEAVHRALTAAAAYFNPTKLGDSPE